MKLLFALLFGLLTVPCIAQQTSGPGYQTALGIKISGGIAASYKTFVNATHAFEAQSMFFNEGIRLVGLYEFHFYTIDGAPGLGWYVGPGAHVGFWRKNAREKYNTRVDIGVDGVIGLDYRIKNAPLNLSLDWQPSLSLIGDAGLSPQFGGLAIRYVF